MSGHFFVTYEIVSEESAAQGDFAEAGFASPGGWKHDDRPEPVTLREALSACGLFAGRSKQGYGFENSGSWFTSIDAEQNYTTGDETRYSIHPKDSITAASYARVCRLLTGKR